MKNIFRKLWYLLIFMLPFEILQISIQGFQIRIYQVIILIVLLLSIYLYRDNIQSKINYILKNIFNLEIYYQNIYLILFTLIWIIASISGYFYGGDINQSFIKSAIALLYLILFIIIFYGIRNKNQLYNVFKTLFYSTGVLILIGVYEGIAFKFGWNTFTVFDGRVDSLLPEPNWLAMFLTIIYAILLPIQLNLQKKWSLWYLMLGLLFIVIASLTRASWLAIFIITGIFFLRNIIWGDKKKNLLKYMTSIAITIFLAVILSQTGITGFNLKDRALSIFTQDMVYYDKEITQYNQDEEISKNIEKDINIIKRQDDYNNALEIGTEYFLTGVGFNGYEHRVGDGRNASNLFLGVFVSSGIIGVSILFTIFYTLVKQSFFFYSSDTKLSNIILNIILAITITGMFNDPYLMGFLWIILAIVTRIPDIIIDDDLDHKSN